jgi:hypothetical protein
MSRSMRRALLVLSVAAVLAAAVVAFSAGPALSYGKATWQTALTGTFEFPGTSFGFGFWGWCDFAGGITSGDDADCQIAEYFHNPPPGMGPAFTCELSINATFWDESGSTFEFVPKPAFAVTGTAVVHPASLSPAQKEACLEFFGSTTGTDLQSVNTFIPVVPGHYDFRNVLDAFFPGAVGEFNFTVKQIPSH